MPENVKDQFKHRARTMANEKKQDLKEARDIELARTLELGECESSSSKPADKATWCHGRQLEILECLGRGSYGEVFRVRDHMSGGFFCLKVGKRHAGVDLEHELGVARDLGNHPNLVTIYGPATGSAGTSFGMVMELCQMNLQQWLLKYPLACSSSSCDISMCQRWSWMAQAAAGLLHMHALGYLHGDVKSCNMLVCKNRRLRLSDFGLSLAMHKGKVEVRGGLVYAAMYRPFECLLHRNQKASFFQGEFFWSCHDRRG